MKFHLINSSFWLFFAFFNLILRAALIGSVTSFELVSNAWVFLVLLAVSNYLRSQYQRFDFTIAIKKLFLHLLLRVVVLSLFANILVFSGIKLYITFADLSIPTTWVNFIGNYVAFFGMLLIWSLAYVFTKNYLEMQSIIVERKAIADSLKTATLNTLIGQINPHFMFNTLNNIRSLVLLDPEKARAMITALSELLRYSLKPKHPDFVSLADELELIDDFIELSKIQYESRLDFKKHVTIDPKTLKVPPMLIQLLIENAIKHGIAKQKNGGLLQLLIESHEQILSIEVINPGSLQVKESTFENTGLGVNNIKERLRLLYNDKASFSLEEKDGKVSAKIEIEI